MLTQDKLPFIPANHFFHAFSDSGKRLFWTLFGALIVACGLLVFNYYSPTFWTSEITTISEPTPAVVNLENVSRNWREMPLQGNALYGFTTFNAAPVSPNLSLVLFYLLFAAIGWAALLAASSKIEGFWGYIIYFLFFSHLFLADVGGLFTDSFSVYVKGAFALGFGLIFLVPAYLFKNQNLYWSVFAQFVLFLSLYLGFYAVIYATGGAAGFFKAAAFPQPLASVITLFVVFFCSKDLSNLILLSTTNYAEPEKRKSFSLIVGVNLLLSITLLILALNEYGVINLSGFLFLKPIHFFIVAALITVFTSQNIYHQWREITPQNLVFCIAILGIVLLAVANLAFQFGATEIYYKAQADRVIATVFGLMSLWYLVYIVVNFMGELREKLNIYYALLISKRFYFAAIWLIVIGMTLFFEARDGNRAKRAMQVTIKNNLADYEIVLGRLDQALLWYNEAIGITPVDPKSNYNFASIKASMLENYKNDDELNEIRDRFMAAEKILPFPQAALSGGNFLTLAGRHLAARRILNSSLQNHFNPMVANNLAGNFFQSGDPDSAIISLKKALLETPNEARLLSNMASIYYKYDRKSQAKAFVEAAFNTDHSDPKVQSNFSFMALAMPDSIKLADADFGIDTADFVSTYNKTMLSYSKADYKTADALAGALLKENPKSADLLMIKMLCEAELGKMDDAKSRYLWLINQFPDYKAGINYAMGLLFFKHDSPEMAQYYFSLAGQNGLESAKLYAVQMLIDMGAHDAAYDSLIVFKTDDKELQKKVQHEMAMLSLAHGDETLFVWDFADISYNEAMRMGYYGLKVKKSQSAARFYEQFANKDTTDHVPYREMGKLFALENLMPTAVEHFDLALKRKPDDFESIFEKSKALFALNKTGEAQTLFDKAKALQPENPALLLFAAQRAEANKDLDGALKQYQAIAERDPLNKKALIGVAKILYVKGQFDKGYKMLNTFTQLNDRSAEIYGLLADFSAKIGFTDAVEDMLNKAVELSPDTGQKRGYEEKIRSLQVKKTANVAFHE